MVLDKILQQLTDIAIYSAYNTISDPLSASAQVSGVYRIILWLINF